MNGIWAPWRGSVIFLSVLIAGAPAMAKDIGSLEITISGRKERLTIDDSRAGVQTFWAVGPVSLYVDAGDGSSVHLTFNENGTGAAEAPHITITSEDGSVWSDVEGTLSATITRADNLPPKFRIAGTFKGRIENGETRHKISGRFEALLPRQDFAPTPGPDSVPDTR